jgi:signal transduction histidine kinase
MQQVNRINNDTMLIIGLSFHLIIGWIFTHSVGDWGYLAPGTIYLLLNAVVYHINRPFWRLSAPYQRFILLLFLASFTMYLEVNVFLSLIPILHMIVVIVVSAFYLMPLLIWFISSIYAVSYLIYFFYLENHKMDYSLVFISVIFIILIVIALHKICLICHLQMTQIRKLERDQNYKRIGQQQHLATIGQIAASIAHDIRNPLTSIQGFVQLIEKNEQRTNYQVYYQIIRSEITRIDTLLREVLLLSKSHTADSDSWDLVHLDVLLERLVVLMEPDALKSNIQIRLHMNKTPVVMGSEDKLQQVFMNLLRNAFEAVSDNGRIDIILNEYNGLAIIQFQDTGSGINEDNQAHLFTPFFTTKSEGTGLGLSICQSIIKAYEGEIKVRNLPGKGAEFTVNLPINLPSINFNL